MMTRGDAGENQRGWWMKGMKREWNEKKKGKEREVQMVWIDLVGCCFVQEDKCPPHEAQLASLDGFTLFSLRPLTKWPPYYASADTDTAVTERSLRCEWVSECWIQIIGRALLNFERRKATRIHNVAHTRDVGRKDQSKKKRRTGERRSAW